MLQSIPFDRVEIRPAERCLLVDGAPVALGARAFDVLLALAERRDRVVSKNELLDLAWPGLVVEENNLSVQISALRKVLGVAAIATVTGRGYRLALQGPPAAGAANEGGAAPPRVLSAVQRLQRRLAAIVQADVVGWSRLVARDASAAVQAWKAARAELIEPTVPHYGGRLVELTPERLLIEFASAVEALGWALALQQALADRRLPVQAGALRMRIGLAVDDVIIDDGKLVGDGVNLAAEVHQVAGHDEVLVTEGVRQLVAHKLPARFEALGERVMRSMSQPLALWRVSEPPPEVQTQALLPDRAWDGLPSLAVLPLAADGPPADAYFGEGMTEEIIGTLALNRGLLVIAHSSTLRYRHGDVDPIRVAGELGVRYVLTGKVRRAAAQLRILVVLVQAPSGQTIWQEQYDGGDDDVFGFQQRIAASIAAAIDPRVQEAEIAGLRGRPTDSFSAYDCVLRGLSLMYAADTGGFDEAGRLFERAIALDPAYAQAHAHLAWWFNLRVGEGRSSQARSDAGRAVVHAQRAAQLDPRDALVLSVAAHIESFLMKRFVPALAMFDQALALNRSCAVAWARSATTLAYLGRGQEAMVRVRNAMRLSPFDQLNFAFCTTSGTATFVLGQYDEAVAWLGKALRLNPRYIAALRLQTAALVLTGDLGEARDMAQALLAADPDFTVSGFGQWYPLQPPHLDKLLAALLRAGLPA